MSGMSQTKVIEGHIDAKDMRIGVVVSRFNAFITEKLLDFLRGTTDAFLKEDLTTKVCSLAERYAPNNLWYVMKRDMRHFFYFE